MYDYHLTVRILRYDMAVPFANVNVMGLPEPIHTFNGVALALGRAGQILGQEPARLVILHHIEIKSGPGLPRSVDAGGDGR